MGGGGQHCSVLVARSNGVNSVLREMKGTNAREGRNEREIGQREKGTDRKSENDNERGKGVSERQ